MNIDLNIIDNNITNIDDIISLLNKSEMDINLKEHLESIKNRLNEMDINNKDELLEVIDAKILEYNMLNEEKKDNITTLKMLKEINPLFNKVNILQSKINQNDSERDIDYITYEREDGTIEVLCCDGNNTINDFISSHKDYISTYKPNELFHHFKEYIHRELKFADLNDITKEEEQEKSIVKDDVTIQKEKEILEEYKNKYFISSPILESIDQFGNRLYSIGNGLFTFKTVEEKRVLQIIQTPDIEKLKEKDNINDMLFELDNDDSLSFEENNNINEENEKEYEFDLEDFKSLIDKEDLFSVTLKGEELEKKNSYLKTMIEKMKEDAEEQRISSVTTTLIDYVMSERLGNPSLYDLYMNNELSGMEEQLVEEFVIYYQQLKELNLINVKKRELVMPKTYREAGVATLVIILEIAMLAFMVTLLLRLDI